MTFGEEQIKVTDTQFDLVFEQASILSVVLQRVGYALWQLAECEDAAAHFLVLRAHATRGMGEERGEALLKGAQHRTFGSVLTELRKKGVVEGDLETRLNDLLKERNWLVHHSKRESRGVINDPDRVDSLIARLDKIAEDASKLQKELGGEIERFSIEAGVNREFIDREAQELAESWGYYF